MKSHKMTQLHSDAPLGPLYIVTERFDASRGEEWAGYLRWSGLTQLREVISLDSMLCEPVVDGRTDEDWSHIVNENFMLDFFTDLPYLLQRVESLKDRNLLCVFRNPPSPPTAPAGFDLIGYDLVDVLGTVSALVNCGGYPDAFANDELSIYGLIPSHERAFQIQRNLREKYPNGEHSNCHVFAVFRKNDA